MVPPRRFRARALAEFLPTTLDPLVAKLGMSQASLLLNWEEIAGPGLAEVCEPIRLKWPPRGPKTAVGRGDPATLALRVTPGFALDIQHLAPALIARVNAHLGWRCVDRIAIRQEALTRKHKPARPAFVVTPAAAAKARALAQAVEDEALKDALTRLGAAVFSRTGGAP